VQDELHLSVVATSRNDNHGGYLTQRTQHFVDGLAAQCRRHGLRAELLLVEWNPPAERPPLAADLAWPADSACPIRIVTVPREIHARLAHGGKLPLFQMIAKNVGIRRARGRFILATNIDILFSDEVMRQLRDGLREGHLYRTDRYDVPTEVPKSADFDAVLEFCRREAFRLHATGFTLLKRDGRWQPGSPLAALFQVIWNAVKRALRRLGERISQPSAPAAPLSQAAPRALRGKLKLLAWSAQWIYHGLIRRELFTNACGDFTLLSREDWFAVRGYPEWPVYSMHLDSILLYQAYHSAIREIYLGAAAPIYHIEHSPGSGFTPESSDKLFQRLAAAGIPSLDWHNDLEPMIAKMSASPKPIRYNDENWGYAGESFSETRVA